MIQLNKPDLINKFLQMESWAYRGRHLVEYANMDKLQMICKRIRKDLEDLEIMLGVDD